MLLNKFLFISGSHNNIDCITDFFRKGRHRKKEKMPHIIVMRGLIIILARLATSCSARKQVAQPDRYLSLDAPGFLPEFWTVYPVHTPQFRV